VSQLCCEHKLALLSAPLPKALSQPWQPARSAWVRLCRLETSNTGAACKAHSSGPLKPTQGPRGSPTNPLERLAAACTVTGTEQGSDGELWPGLQSTQSLPQPQLNALQLGKGGKCHEKPPADPALSSPLLQQSLAAVTGSAGLTVLHGREQASQELPVCLFQTSPVSWAEPVRIPGHAKAAGHRFPQVTVFGSSASPPLQGTGKGI